MAYEKARIIGKYFLCFTGFILMVILAAVFGYFVGTTRVVPEKTTIETIKEECARVNIDLVFAVDMSGSICDEDPSDEQITGRRWCRNWESTINFVKDVVDVLTIGPSASQVALLLFDGTVQVQWQLNNYTDKNLLNEAVSDLEDRYGGGTTNTPEALKVTREMYESLNSEKRAGAQDIVLLITDGVPTVTPEETIPEANKLKAIGAKIYCVGITNAIDEASLRNISSPPQEEGKSYFLSTDFSSVSTVLESLLTEACKEIPNK